MVDKNRQTKEPPVLTGLDPHGVGWHPSSGADAGPKIEDAVERSSASVQGEVSQDSSPVSNVRHQPPATSLWSTLWGAKVAIVGEVRGFQTRTENKGRDAGNVIVWTFRLQRYDNSGNELPPLPVEMRGKRFQGFINEGDRVEVHGRWKEGRAVRAKQVHNLTTDVVVKSH
jgi:hypothetical protein